MAEIAAGGRPRSAALFVGREAELAAVAQAIDAAVAGQPCVLLVSGEPGVGKSRLIAEARALAERRGLQVLQGHALESGGMPLYFPFARALAPALAQPAGAGAAPLPVLAAAGIAPATAAGAPPRLEPEAERLRLFDAIADTCLRLAAQRPLLLALDDLQWAEPAAWDATVYLARALGEAPLLLLLAVREEALQVDGGAAPRAVSELNRQRLLRRLPLRRLGVDAVTALAGATVGGALSPELGELIAERSQGNPFFAEEIALGLLEQDALASTAAGWELRPERREQARTALPLTLRLAVSRRLERLPEETRRVLRAAAVLGRAATARTLARMLGQDEEPVEDALAPAQAAGLMVETAEGWTFAHDTIRQTVYESAGPARRRLHAAAAAALEAEAGVPALPALAALAFHWRLAGEPARGADAALAAAQAASAVRATAEALAYARTGRELREQAATGASAGDGAGGTVAVARFAHGEAALAAGEYAEAEEALRAALGDAQARGERMLTARAWTRLGVLFRRREAPDEAAGCLRAALALLEEAGDETVELAEVLIELAGLEGLTRARYDEAEALGRRALAIAGRLRRPALEASAALTLANSLSRSSDPVPVRRLLRTALERSLAGDEPGIAAEAAAALANAYYWTGEIGASQQFAERRLELAGRAGDVFGLRHAHSWLANLAWSRGEWETSRRLLREAEPVLARLESPEPIAFLRLVDGMIDYRTGSHARAYEQIDGAMRLFERVDPATVVWYAGWHALVCLALGRTDEAERQIAAQEARLAALPEPALPARSARNLLALAYAELGDRKRGAACERALAPYAADFHWSPARRSLAALAGLRGDREGALALLAAAETQARQEELRPDLALTLLARSRLQPGRERAEAEALLYELEMAWVLERQPAGAGSDAHGPAGLTAREQEVLRLVAQGKTNREIAAALVISERTAINHLSHIFAKIGVENRAGATAFALRHGIA